MKKKKYTLKIEITSSLFPNHPHLAVSSSKEDVGSGEGYTIHFEPDWDGWGDDPEDSSA
jgi:hypothetical protein